ncbi:GNAT family N-acetyltransferase [Corynebacterium aquatimens]|uniref:Ribosomal protein S18 acetylase RimI-like enzyme n=1 Tax=Corynebacterium aquatimens TaxID=1190508 RepID=A0A931E1L3_9CORY|nr:N-acetyltransferase [Corynebacterium aquatimens]MBG6121975.1 ribosomal protein S18 acetylase RimI-like enzyme [Corynebacterium aquatimens]
MTIRIRRLSGFEFARASPHLVDIHLRAMGYPPSMKDQRMRSWRNDVFNRGFVAYIACETRDESVADPQPAGEEFVVGVAYGFLGNPDLWWDQQLRRGLLESKWYPSVSAPDGPRGPVRGDFPEFVRSYFEVAEIHVLPEAQGKGIGRTLLTTLLDGVPARHALLSTPEVAGEQNSAFGLYRSLGFQDVLRNFMYAGDHRPFAILGRSLPLG